MLYAPFGSVALNTTRIFIPDSPGGLSDGNPGKTGLVYLTTASPLAFVTAVKVSKEPPPDTIENVTGIPLTDEPEPPVTVAVNILSTVLPAQPPEKPFGFALRLTVIPVPAVRVMTSTPLLLPKVAATLSWTIMSELLPPAV
jgi:hypothetical protein